ncbi:MAG: tetratricopeptide repeat protein [Fibrobacteria bacterium]|nr:tetratricopeptide repeat protein [Fibrobacteria bacterium]
MKTIHFFSLATLLLFSSCARLAKLEQDTSHTKKQVDHLQVSVDKMIGAIDDLNINQGGATSKMKADLTMLLKQLETQLDLLKAEMDESQYRMRQLEKKIEALNNQKVILSGSFNGQDSNVIPAQDSSADTSATTSASNGQQAVKVIPGLEIEKLYHQAREDYIIGKYKLALKGFQTVFDKDAGGSYKDNALYWIGECHYKQKNFKEAVTYYQRCVQEFPHGNKKCSALFKLGMVYKSLQQKEECSSSWKNLMTNCPSSNEAFRAKEMSCEE